MNYKAISFILLMGFTGFIFVLLDVFRLLKYNENKKINYMSCRIKLKIAFKAYIERFFILFLFIFLVIYKLLLEYLFSIVPDNQIYNAFLVTTIIITGIYSYLVIFDIEISIIDNNSVKKEEK